MSTATKLSNILLTAALGASASAASATEADVTYPTPPVHSVNTIYVNQDSQAKAAAEAAAKANAAAYEKIFNQTIKGGEGGNAIGGSVSSITVSTATYIAPKILKERYNLGPCSGPAYQALWQTVKFSSLFSKHAVLGLVGVTDNSFTIRQFKTESDADRGSAVQAIDGKINPKPITPAVIDPTPNASNSQTSTSTKGGEGGSATAAQGGNAIASTTASYTVPKTYKDVTYHCTLGK